MISHVFIGEMRCVIDSFDNFEMNVTTVLQYFIWTGRNKKISESSH